MTYIEIFFCVRVSACLYKDIGWGQKIWDAKSNLNLEIKKMYDCIAYYF